MNPDNSAAALAQLQQTQAAAQNPNDILSGQRQQLGVQGAQDTVTGLRGAIDNTTKLLKQVAPSVMGRTANSLVTNAQASRQIQNEQAPISQTLTDQGTQYNEAGQDLSKLQDQASQAANGIYQGQQDKLSYAQNLYNTLFQKEQAAQKAQQDEADRQESTRQFNESLAQQKAASSASAGSSFNLGNDAAAPTSQVRVVHKGSDYHFYDSNNQPVTAAQYAKSSGQTLGDVLRSMAAGGDKSAAAAYGAVQSAGGLSPKLLSDLQVKYPYLLGGI